MCVTALLIRISIVENASKAMLSETAFLRTSKVGMYSVSFESSFQPFGLHVYRKG
jgi:hypothetical protein